uniref:Pentatricopeptide repeat-containing protein At1g31430 family n=1 Tax=Cajanus cajan TaxID=3821 RepID=A0A151QVB2_CAJCA|nr:Pentatricopeptide repeat-containing protein At1g31430 family [Cajanus cajan]
MSQLKQIQTHVFCIGLQQDRDTLNKLMAFSMHLSLGDFNYANRIFNHIHDPSLFNYNLMIKAFVKMGSFCSAISLFHQLREHGVWPDNYTYPYVLKGISCIGEVRKGEKVHAFVVKTGLEFDPSVCNSLMDMYVELGIVEGFCQVFEEMPERDSVSWNIMISGYVKCRSWIKLWICLRRVQVGHCSLNRKRILPHGLQLFVAMNGRTREALEFFDAMQTCGLKPGDVTFIAILSACQAGLVEEGRKLFHSMSSIYHIEPNLEHYGCFIDLLGRAELVKKLPDQKDEVIVPLYGALLSAYRIYGNIDMGERLATMLAKVKSSDSSLHSLLASIYASVDRWEYVRKVRSNMKNLGIKKVPGYSAISIEVYGKGGNSGGVGNLSHFGTNISLPTLHR